MLPDKSQQKVLLLTIIDGDGSEAETVMKAMRASGIDKEYFIFLSRKPFALATREDFEAVIKVAMKALMPKQKQQNESANVANPLFEGNQEPEE